LWLKHIAGDHSSTSLSHSGNPAYYQAVTVYFLLFCNDEEGREVSNTIQTTEYGMQSGSETLFRNYSEGIRVLLSFCNSPTP
jgi:hypothetical protein